MGAGWWRVALLKLYDFLNRNEPLQAADLIVVLAGRMDRKQYGLELFRSGVAPHALVSVGRFEVSRMAMLPIEGIPALLALRDATPAEERHFFLTLSASGTRAERVKLQRWSTYGEALAFRHYLDSANARRVIVVSTGIHLRRVALTFSRVFRERAVEFIYRAVPSSHSVLGRESWWTRKEVRRFVVLEATKLAGYRVILSLPEWLVRRLMRLQD